MAFNFPKKLKIGAHTYAVRYVTVPKGIESSNVAQVDNTKSVIVVDKELAPSQRYEALWHEILHVINGELPEREVDGLAQQIVQVLADNEI